MIVNWLIHGLLLVCAVILLTGRGSWMIAGYNTASPEEKSKYDEKKLTRAVGITLLVIDLATFPILYVRSTAYIIFYIVSFIAAVLALLFYTNKKCFKEGAARKPGSGAVRKHNKAVYIVLAVFFLAVAAGSVVLVLSGAKTAAYALSPDSSAFTIDSMYGLTISTSDIQSLELKATLPSNLNRTNGYGGVGTVLKGFCSSDIGDVRVFIDTSKSLFLYIMTPSEVIILNGETDEETQRLYDMLNAAVLAAGLT